MSNPRPMVEGPFVDRKGVLTNDGVDYLLSLGNDVNQTTRRLTSVNLVLQQAAIGTTPIPLGALAGGLYRVTFYLRITQPGTVSSSAQVTLGWTDGGVVMSKTFANVNGNLTTSFDTDTILVENDQALALTYAIAYASAGATPMQFKLRIVIESVG